MQNNQETERLAKKQNKQEPTGKSSKSASGSLSKRKARKRALHILNQTDYYAADKRKF
jgi:hypothetical protein